MHNNFGLTVLQNLIRLITFKRSDLRSSIGVALLEILLRDHGGKFFSLIASNDEISLAMDHADFASAFLRADLALAHDPSSLAAGAGASRLTQAHPRKPTEAFASMSVHENKWRAIQFTAGSLGLGTSPTLTLPLIHSTEKEIGTGAVSQIAPILAQKGVSIYYLSTCNDDFILVRISLSLRSLSLPISLTVFSSSTFV